MRRHGIFAVLCVVSVLQCAVMAGDLMQSNVSSDSSPVLKSGFPLHFPETYLRRQPIAADLNNDFFPEFLVPSTKGIFVIGADASQQIFTFNPQHGETIVQSPVVGDVDGDGSLEVVAVASWNRVLIWDECADLKYSWWLDFNGYATEDPLLSDVDSDGALDIVLVEGRSWIHVLRADGRELPGWPVRAGSSITNSVSAGDVDRDGSTEIIAAKYADPDRLLVFGYDGTQRLSIPLATRYSADYTPVLADVNEDGAQEIILLTGSFIKPGWVYIFDGQGSTLPGWPVPNQERLSSRVSVADLDQDGRPEVVHGGECVWAYHADGTLVHGLPWRVKDYSNPTYPPYPSSLSTSADILVGNVDRDAAPEFVVSINERLHAFKLDGTIVPGWPIPQDADASPVLLDFDRDGQQEVAFYHSNSDGDVYLYDISARADTCRWQWPMYRHDWLGSSSFTLPGSWRCRSESTRYLFQQESLDID